MAETTRWNEITKTAVTISIKGPVDWSNKDCFGIGEVQLPRRIFGWPHSDRIFVLEDGWTAERFADGLLIFPLSLDEGDEGYEQFVIPLAAVENFCVHCRTKFVAETIAEEAIPVSTTVN